MFFDILILIIIVLCAVFGFRNGFLISLSRIGGWLGALIVAFLFRSKVNTWLLAHTSFYEKTQARIDAVCQTFVANYTGDGDPSGGAGGFSAKLEEIGHALASAAAEQITAHLWNVLVFVGIVFGIKIILFVLTLLLSKKFHSGVIGGIDGVAGLLFGLFQAVVCILVVFALVLPISYTFSAKTHDDIDKSMDDSIIAKLIYENNPLLDFIDGFLPTGLTPEKWLNENNYQNVLNSSSANRPQQSSADDFLSLLNGLRGSGGSGDSGDSGDSEDSWDEPADEPEPDGAAGAAEPDEAADEPGAEGG